jgi:hypothetical protein
MELGLLLTKLLIVCRNMIVKVLKSRIEFLIRICDPLALRYIAKLMSTDPEFL